MRNLKSIVMLCVNKGIFCISGPSSEEAFVKLEEEVEKSSFLVTVNGVAYKASSIR